MKCVTVFNFKKLEMSLSALVNAVLNTIEQTEQMDKTKSINQSINFVSGN